MLKVVLGIPWYFPYSVGGTEVYVAGLADELGKLNVECVIATPSLTGKDATSAYRNVRVVYYPAPAKPTSAYGILASGPADAFQEWLASEGADIYHQHDWSFDCGLTTLQAAKKLRIPTIMTLHLAKVLCRVSTMMYENNSPCDGEIVERRCTRCFLISRGLPGGIANAISRLPLGTSEALSKLPVAGPIFSGRTAARNYANGLQSTAAAAHRIVAVSEWLKQALLINGIPPAKISLVRSGVDPDILTSVNDYARSKSCVLRIGFIGRANPVKGLHVLIQALLQLPKMADFELKGLLLSEPPHSRSYLTMINQQIAGQSNIQLSLDQPRSVVSVLLGSIDVLAVPSQCLETGPLVVLEANAWGVPVVGSNLGGIRELIRSGIDGLLVPHADIAAWTKAFLALAKDRSLLHRLKGGIRRVRTMRDTASEMLDVYRSVANKK